MFFSFLEFVFRQLRTSYYEDRAVLQESIKSRLQLHKPDENHAILLNSRRKNCITSAKKKR